ERLLLATVRRPDDGPQRDEHDRPRREQRDHDLVGVREARAREQHHADAEREREERVKPPEAPQDAPQPRWWWRVRVNLGLRAHAISVTSRRVRDHLAEAIESNVELLHLRSEGKSQMAAEARCAPTATLTGIDVEELAGHADHLALERGTEE